MVTRFGRQPKLTTIDGDELIRLLIEAVPGQALIGVRDCDLIKVGVVEVAPNVARRALGAEAPVAVHQEDRAAGRISLNRLGDTGPFERKRRQGCAAGSHEFATFHTNRAEYIASPLKSSAAVLGCKAT